MVQLLPAAVAAQLGAEPLTYPEVGATRGVLPTGYRHQRLAIPVGRGTRQLDAAAEALLTWQMHGDAGLAPSVSDLRVRPGTVAILHFGLRALRLRVPVRVVEVVDEPGRQGFVYGTLPGHPERGEESFVLSLDDDGTVVFTVLAFSRAGRWYTRLGFPVARALQLLVTRRYGGALRARARAATGD